MFCVLFILLYTAASFLFLYKFTDRWHRVETQLQYHILSPAETTLCTRGQSQRVTVSRSIRVGVNPLRDLIITHSYTSPLFCKQETPQCCPKWQFAPFLQKSLFYAPGALVKTNSTRRKSKMIRHDIVPSEISGWRPTAQPAKGRSENEKEQITRWCKLTKGVKEKKG